MSKARGKKADKKKETTLSRLDHGLGGLRLAADVSDAAKQLADALFRLRKVLPAAGTGRNLMLIRS